MRSSWVFVAPVLLTACAARTAPVTTARGQAKSPVERPNIIVVLSDDQGWATLGSYGSAAVRTPYLDRLAAEGTRFTQAYVTPQCTPTRAALLTGQQTARTGMWHVIPGHSLPWARMQEPAYVRDLPPDAYNLAKGLRGSGYATALIGKWHLTQNGDGDYERLYAESASRYGFDRVGWSPAHKRGDKAVDELTGQAAAFLTDNRHRPFFLLLSHYTVHQPLGAPESLVRAYRSRGAPATGLNNATYLAAIEHLDASVGRLLAKVDELGLRERTIFMFLSDNGGVDTQYDKAGLVQDRPGARLPIKERQFTSGPLRGWKGRLYEGGIRVPLLVRWPGVTSPGVASDVPVHAVDLLPTLLDAARVRPPAGYVLDGLSLKPVLAGGPAPDRTLFWYAPLYDLGWGATPAAAIRRGRYKLIESFGDHFDEQGVYVPAGVQELFDLQSDPGERRNLAASDPNRARSLSKELRRWIAEMGAVVPQPNPRHQAARAFEIAAPGHAPERPITERF